MFPSILGLEVTTGLRPPACGAGLGSRLRKEQGCGWTSCPGSADTPGHPGSVSRVPHPLCHGAQSSPLLGSRAGGLLRPPSMVLKGRGGGRGRDPGNLGSFPLGSCHVFAQHRPLTKPVGRRRGGWGLWLHQLGRRCPQSSVWVGFTQTPWAVAGDGPWGQAGPACFLL